MAGGNLVEFGVFFSSYSLRWDARALGTKDNQEMDWLVFHGDYVS